jgi:Uma2 family endonuclease
MATAIMQPVSADADSNGLGPRLHRFSVEKYHRMIDAGILQEGAPIELIRGLLVTKMTRYPPHDSSLLRIGRILNRLLPDDWLPRQQSAITLRDSEPEPDFAVVSGPDEKYGQRHPRPRDIALVIEVAESSLDYDRRVKGPLYADHRLPEYWIVNVVEDCLEVYTRPRSGKTAGYQDCTVLRPEDSVPLLLDGVLIAKLKVKDLLPA